MTDRELRGKLQSMGYWFAASRCGGPTHIVKHHEGSLCGVDYNTRLLFKAKNLCKRCRRAALKLIES